MKNLFNLESWSFPKLILVKRKQNSYQINCKTLELVVNFSSNQSFFIVWNQTQINYCCLRRNKIEGSCLSLKDQAKFLFNTQKLYQSTNIFCKPLWSVFTEPLDTNLLTARGTLGLQCISRAQLIIQTEHIHYRLPCNYVTNLLA